MEVADRRQSQIVEVRLRLAEAQESPAPHIDQHLRPAIKPQQVACGGALALDGGSAGPQDLDHDRIAGAALRRCARGEREESEQAERGRSEHENTSVGLRQDVRIAMRLVALSPIQHATKLDRRAQKTYYWLVVKQVW